MFVSICFFVLRGWTDLLLTAYTFLAISYYFELSLFVLYIYYRARFGINGLEEGRNAMNLWAAYYAIGGQEGDLDWIG